jgi:hypothetical protein
MSHIEVFWGSGSQLPFDAKYPRLASWLTRFEALPGYDRTYPPHWR